MCAGREPHSNNLDSRFRRIAKKNRLVGSDAKRTLKTNLARILSQKSMIVLRGLRDQTSAKRGQDRNA